MLRTSTRLVAPESSMMQWLRTEYEESIRQFCDVCLAMDTGNYEQLAVLKILQREAVAAKRKIVVKLWN
ncbi:MAG: hypothetical protein KME43_21185 [Myxacorys chilensis ATA2-1-KO14]|nr:hypothetical protein [Myxacorys chilensis ATA2-1-KO14]